MSPREEISGRMGTIMGTIARIQSYAQPTNSQLDEAERLLEEHSQLERQLRAISLDELRAFVTGAGDTNLRAVPGAIGDLDRDPFNNPADSTPVYPWATGEVQMFGRSRDSIATEYRSRALSAIEHMPAASDRIRSAATDLVESFDAEDGRLSQLALALSEPTYLRAFAKK
jgi:hypothetical protein